MFLCFAFAKSGSDNFACLIFRAVVSDAFISLDLFCVEIFANLAYLGLFVLCAK